MRITYRSVPGVACGVFGSAGAQLIGYPICDTSRGRCRWGDLCRTTSAERTHDEQREEIRNRAGVRHRGVMELLAEPIGDGHGELDGTILRRGWSTTTSGPWRVLLNGRYHS